MNPNSLRQRVEIQRAVEAKSTSGAVTTSWLTLLTAWASVEPLQGRELWQAQQVQANVTHRVRLRFVDGITAKDRVVHRSRVLHIEAVINPQERRVSLELLCQEAA